MSRILNGTRTILKKELKDSLRDRRALLTAMLPALIAPVFMVFMFNSIAETRNTEEDLIVQVTGQENAPDLIQFLSERDIVIADYDGNEKQDIQAGKIEIVLEIPEDYAEKFARSEPATVYLHSDNSIDRSEVAAGRLNDLLQEYRATIGSMRLLVRGINPAISSAVVVENKDYSTDASRAGQILSAMQMFILMAAFFGSAPSAIDVTAGERERNSLEPLLIHPISSLQIVLGKYFSVCCFGLLATVIAVLVTSIALDSISLESLGVDPRLNLNMQLGVIVTLVPIVLLAAALQMLLSLFSKTFKEAQSYTGLLTILPVLVVLPSMTGTATDADWMLFAPLLSQKLLLDRVLRGDGLEFLDLLVASGITVAVTALIVMTLVRILRSERVVYGN